MIKRQTLDEGIPFAFPFVAELKGQEIDHRRIDVPVIVLGYSGLERHYLRIKSDCTTQTVASDSMLVVDLPG